MKNFEPGQSPTAYQNDLTEGHIVKLDMLVYLVLLIRLQEILECIVKAQGLDLEKVKFPSLLAQFHSP